MTSNSAAATVGVAARRLAFRALRRVHRDGAWASAAVDHELRAASLDGRDRAFATNLAFSTLRWEGTLDWALSQVVRRPLGQVEPDVLDVLRLGAWQVLYGQVPDRAAVSTAVDTARAELPERTAGFANGVLRALARQRGDLAWPDSDTVEGRALALGYPRWVVEQADRRFGASSRAGSIDAVDAADATAGAADAELAAGNRPAPVTVRAADPELASAQLAAAGATVTRGSYAPDAVHVVGLLPSELMARFGDRLVIQDEAAMVVARALDASVASGATVLDVCAAPGGKATHLAQLGKTVIAADRHAGRSQLIAALAARIGVSPSIVVADGAAPPWSPETFDGVLVDAPCTGLGVVRRRPELRWRREHADIASLAAVQSRLLAASADLVAPGGAMLYSVCTWTHAETVDVVVRFLRARPDFALAPVPEIDSVAPGPGVQLGTAEHGTDGMYLAVLRRNT